MRRMGVGLPYTPYPVATAAPMTLPCHRFRRTLPAPLAAKEISSADHEVKLSQRIEWEKGRQAHPQ